MDITSPRLLLPLFCLLLPVSGWSDEVFLKNGDRLTGTVKTTKEGKLMVKTSYAGDIGIALKDIQRVVTEKPVSVTLDDETTLTGILSSPDGAGMRIAADVDQEARTVAMEQITAITIPEIPGVKIKGSSNVGLDMNRGNTDQDTYHVDAGRHGCANFLLFQLSGKSDICFVAL